LIDDEAIIHPEDTVDPNSISSSSVFGFLGGVFSRSDSRPVSRMAPSVSLGSSRVDEEVANAVFEMLPVVIEVVLVAFQLSQHVHIIVSAGVAGRLSCLLTA
jgi:hypothetical protein